MISYIANGSIAPIFTVANMTKIFHFRLFSILSVVRDTTKSMPPINSLNRMLKGLYVLKSHCEALATANP